MPNNLLILPFDHRSSFSRDILGIQGKISPEQLEKIKELKAIVYAGFEKTAKTYVEEKKLYSYEDFGILVDQVYGADLLKHAQNLGVKVAIPVEKSGKEVFEFTYGDDFGLYVDNVQPDYVKALVRYNPRNKTDNKTQLERLHVLSEFCQKKKYKLLFELLVPPTPEDLFDAGTKEIYDTKLRHIITAQAVLEIVPKVKVDLWKVEGLEPGQWAEVLKPMSLDSKVIVLGRAASDEQVTKWLVEAAKFPKVIGFAVGRSIFNEPLVNYVHSKLSKTETVNLISSNFSKFVEIWHVNRT